MSSESRFSKPPGSTVAIMRNRQRDIEMLDALLGAHEDVRDDEREAFACMKESLGKFVALTPPQRYWVVRRYEELVKSGVILPPREIPRGKEVALMVGALPKKPPPRRPDADEDALRPKHTPRDETPFRPQGLDDKETT